METYEMKLTESQQRHYESVRWLLYGGKQSGRTFVLACAAIEESLGNQKFVKVCDHSNSYNGDKFLLKSIENIYEEHFDKLIYKLVIKHKTNEILFTYRTRKERIEYEKQNKKTR